MIETWRAIPGLEHYEASSEGRIRSLDRTVSLRNRWGKMMERAHKGRILKLKPKPNGNGLIYWTFIPSRGNDWQVNRAVCWAFHGAPPSDVHQAAHLDGDTNNNCPPNLIWATCAENMSHKVGHGTAPIGSMNAMARVKESDIPVIIQRYAAGETSESLGAEYGITFHGILFIIRGETWAHVPSQHREAARIRAAQNRMQAPRR